MPPKSFTMNRPILPNVPQEPYGARQAQMINAPPNAQDPSGGKGAPGAAGHAPPAKPTYAKRGKITIVACVPCRKRKTKCDGKRPACSQCVARAGQCAYDMTDDQRKLTYLRDNVEQLQDRSNALESLLHTFQNANDEEAAEVFRRLRSGTDVNLVAEQVQAGRLLSGVGLPSSRGHMVSRMVSRDSDRLRQFETFVGKLSKGSPTDSDDIIQRLRGGEDVASILSATQPGSIAPPPLLTRASESNSGLEGDFSTQEQTFGMVKGADVSATHASNSRGSEFIISHIRHPWTEVTQDNDLVEHLLTLYFTWQHSFFQSFPEKLFRADMAAGRTKYCSSILVNSICAAGCFLSSREAVRRDLGGGRTILTRFFDEAVRLLNETEASSIATTASLYLLSYVEGTRGNLTTLWMYSGRSSLMALDLNIHLRQSRKNNSGTEEEEEEIYREEKARSHAFWGCFHVDQLTSFTLGRPPNLNINSVTVDLPPSDDDEDDEPWEAYEMGLPNKPGARATTFRQCSCLSKIINSTLMMFFAPNVPLSGALLLDEYQKYLDWYKNVPTTVSNTDQAPPHVLCLHLYYHAAVLLLFRPFLKATITQSDVIPRDICRESANNISDIIEHHRSLYGLNGIYMFQVHCLLTACTIHIVNLPTVSSINYLTRACNTFQDMIPLNAWARSSLGILRGLVEKWGLVLPRVTEEAMYRDVPGQVPARGNTPGSPRRSRSKNQIGHLEPLGPDPLAYHPASNELSHQQLTVPVDPRLSEEGYQFPQAGAGEASVEQQAGDGSNSSKRPSGRQPSPAAGRGGSKRQRTTLQGDDGRGSASTLAKIAGRPRRKQIQEQHLRQQPSATNYLYSPVTGQSPPLLVPVHSASSSGGSKTAGGRKESQQSGTSGGAGGEEGAAGSEKAQRSKAPGEGGVGNSNGGKKVKQQGDDEDEVEGMSFGDDWRDPFMGYLEQDE